MKFFLTLILLCFSLELGFSGQERKVLDKADYILPCQKSSPDIVACVIKGINHLKPYLVQGIEEIEMPSIDPFKIGQLILDNGDGPFSLKSDFTELVVKGVKDFTITSLKIQFDPLIVEIRIGLPKLEIRGNYDVKGKILQIPIVSRGSFSSVLFGVEVIAKAKAKEETDENRIRFLQIDTLTIDFNVKDTQFDLQDESQLKTVIGNSIINLLNQYSQEVMKATKPTTAHVLANRFKELLNPILLHLPLKLFLPDA